MSNLFAVPLAALFGAVVGFAARRLLARLRRGAVIRPGWMEVGSALLSGLGLVCARDGAWPLVIWIGVLGVALTAVDLKHHRLPDAITLPAIAITYAVVVLTHCMIGDGDLLRAALAGAALGGAFSALAFAAPKAMGRGDAKLAFTLGIALGYLSWMAVLLGVLLASVIGSLVGAAGMLAGRVRLKSALPFGPSLLLGCWLVLAVPGLLGLTR